MSKRPTTASLADENPAVGGVATVDRALYLLAAHLRQHYAGAFIERAGRMHPLVQKHRLAPARVAGCLLDLCGVQPRRAATTVHLPPPRSWPAPIAAQAHPGLLRVNVNSTRSGGIHATTPGKGGAGIPLTKKTFNEEARTLLNGYSTTFQPISPEHIIQPEISV